jgi:hypothetical protein
MAFPDLGSACLANAARNSPVSYVFASQVAYDKSLRDRPADLGATILLAVIATV